MTEYLRNCWYMAAWSDEVNDEGVLVRTLLDEPIVLFRDSGGVLHALFDRCPHRFAPLSLGEKRGDALACRYHGLCFGAEGACVDNPHGPIVSAMRVKAYPVIERYRAAWIWMGDPDRADTSQLRDLSFLSDAPDTAFSKGYINGAADYQLFVDNILDLTHADFLHPTTLGGGAITRTRAKVEESDNEVAIKWHGFDETPSPIMAARLPPGAKADFWTEVSWTAPGVMILRNCAVPTGIPRNGAEELTNVHIIMPGTAKTCHYFYASTRNFEVGNEAINLGIKRRRDEIFATEDEPMIRAIQSRMGDSGFWDLNPLLLRIDEGAVRVRRTLERLIADERSTPEAAPLRISR